MISFRPCLAGPSLRAEVGEGPDWIVEDRQMRLTGGKAPGTARRDRHRILRLAAEPGQLTGDEISPVRHGQ
jgi:hypothetical protein